MNLQHGVFTAVVCKENSSVKIYIPEGIVQVLRLTLRDKVNVELTKARGKFCEGCGKLRDQCKCEVIG